MASMLLKGPQRCGVLCNQTSSSTTSLPARCSRRLSVSASVGWQPEQQPSSSGRVDGATAWGASWSGEIKKRRARQSNPGKPATKPSPPDDASSQQLDAAIHANVERAAAMLDEVMQEIGQEAFLGEATAFLYEDTADVTLQQAIRDAVSKRIDFLDGNFLAALNAYVAAAGQQPGSPLVPVLAAIRAEVLQQVADRLPAAVRVLNTALALPSRSDRKAVLLTALAGGGRPVLGTSASASSSTSPSTSSPDTGSTGGPDEGTSSAGSSPQSMPEASGAGSSAGVPEVPSANLEALAASSIQLVDDMEDQEIIADRVLLARLVLLREELRAQAEKQRSAAMMDQQEAAASSSAAGSSDKAPDGGFFSYQRANLPMRCAALLKELLAVSERARRLGLLRKSFTEDWDFAGQPGPRRLQNEAPDVVRPGRFLTTLHSTKQELQQAFVEGKLVGQGQADGGAKLLERLEQIEFDALVVLDGIQSEASGQDAAAAGPGDAAGIPQGPDYQVPVTM